jgi:hypothetical protein
LDSGAGQAFVPDNNNSLYVLKYQWNNQGLVMTRPSERETCKSGIDLLQNEIATAKTASQ